MILQSRRRFRSTRHARPLQRPFPTAAALLAALLAVPLAISGCAGDRHALGEPVGPRYAASVHVAPLAYAAPDAALIRTEHYKIYTTVQDRPDVIERMGQVMEGAFALYAGLCPGVALTREPLDCYLFARRDQWAAFTREHTGADAATYLHITRGGYTIHDWYVAYFIGDVGTYSVAAHEGWHQFVARHFKGRLPPFLEEGIATTFEDVTWENDLPRWNLSINRLRAAALRKALDDGQLWPLSELIALHAGQVVGQPGGKVEAFYAQDWAFARFLREGEGGKYRGAFDAILADTAAGTVFDPTGSHRMATAPWRPAGVRPMLEHYLRADLGQIEQEYLAFVRHVARDEYYEQFHPEGS